MTICVTGYYTRAGEEGVLVELCGGVTRSTIARDDHVIQWGMSESGPPMLALRALTWLNGSFFDSLSRRHPRKTAILQRSGCVVPDCLTYVPLELQVLDVDVKGMREGACAYWVDPPALDTTCCI